MRDKLAMRTEAILDSLTGVVGIPSIVSSYGRDRYSRRYLQSDVEKSWTNVGKYMSLAIGEIEAERENAPTEQESKYDA